MDSDVISILMAHRDEAQRRARRDAAVIREVIRRQARDVRVIPVDDYDPTDYLARGDG